MLRVAAAFLHRGLKGAAREVHRSSGPWWGRGPCTWCQMPVELGTSWQFSTCSPADWPSSSPLGSLALPKQAIALIVAQVTFPQTALIVGSRFSDRAHCNEFVESRSKSWALMRRRLVLGMKSTHNRAAQRPREKGPLARGWECANPSRSHRNLLPVSGPPCFWASLSFLVVPPFFVRSLLLYILLFYSSSSYTC